MPVTRHQRKIYHNSGYLYLFCEDRSGACDKQRTRLHAPIYYYSTARIDISLLGVTRIYPPVRGLANYETLRTKRDFRKGV